MSSVVIEEWIPGADPSAELAGLADVLHAAVHAGASVNFILPFSVEEARAFWCSKVLPEVRSGGRRVLIARVDGRIAGTVQLVLDLPPNQRHRAEVAKLLVHPFARRQGLARRLMNGTFGIDGWRRSHVLCNPFGVRGSPGLSLPGCAAATLGC